MKGLLVAAVFAALGGIAVNKPIQRATEPVNFSIVVTTTVNGWAATCDSGCRWKGLSFACASACPAIIDANGLVTLASIRSDSTPFSIVLHHDFHGAQATSRGGTAWTRLAWDCQSFPCRARVDRLGVVLLDSGR
jgi:hypothetical protein